MALPTLESLTAKLDAETVGLLGDSIAYTPAGGATIGIKAFVDHRDKTDGFGGAQITDQNIIITTRKIDVVQPNYGDIFFLPELGMSVSPRDWRSTESGRHWEIFVARVR
jgi:hypothetical protein